MLRKDVGITFFGNGTALLLEMGTGVVLARSLGPTGRGLLALALLLPRILSRFASLGQENVNTTFAGLYKRRRASLFVQSFLFAGSSAAFAAATVAVCLAVLPAEGSEFARLPRDLIWAGCAFVPATVLRVLLLGLTRGVGRIRAASIVYVTGSTTRLAACLLLLVGLGAGVRAAYWVFVGVPLLESALATWVLLPHLSGGRLRLSRALLGKSVAFGGINSLAMFAGFLVYRVDQGMLGFMTLAGQVGLYVVAVGLAEKLKVLPNSVAVAFLPRLANELGMMQKQVPLVFRGTAVISAGAAVLAALLGPPAIYVMFGPDYLSAIWPFLILLPGIAALGANTVLAGDLLTRQKPIYNVILAWSNLGLNVGLNFVLIPVLGISGAALASTASYFSATVGRLWIYRHMTGTPIREMIPGPRDVRAVAAAARAILKAGRARVGKPAASPDEPAPPSRDEDPS